MKRSYLVSIQKWFAKKTVLYLVNTKFGSQVYRNLYLSFSYWLFQTILQSLYFFIEARSDYTLYKRFQHKQNKYRRTMTGRTLQVNLKDFRFRNCRFHRKFRKLDSNIKCWICHNGSARFFDKSSFLIFSTNNNK